MAEPRRAMHKLDVDEDYAQFDDDEVDEVDSKKPVIARDSNVPFSVLNSVFFPPTPSPTNDERLEADGNGVSDPRGQDTDEMDWSAIREDILMTDVETHADGFSWDSSTTLEREPGELEPDAKCDCQGCHTRDLLDKYGQQNPLRELPSFGEVLSNQDVPHEVQGDGAKWFECKHCGVPRAEHKRRPYGGRRNICNKCVINKKTGKVLETKMRLCKRCGKHWCQEMFYWPPFPGRRTLLKRCRQCLTQAALGCPPRGADVTIADYEAWGQAATSNGATESTMDLFECATCKDIERLQDRRLNGNCKFCAKCQVFNCKFCHLLRADEHHDIYGSVDSMCKYCVNNTAIIGWETPLALMDPFLQARLETELKWCVTCDKSGARILFYWTPWTLEKDECRKCQLQRLNHKIHPQASLPELSTEECEEFARTIVDPDWDLADPTKSQVSHMPGALQNIQQLAPSPKISTTEEIQASLLKKQPQAPSNTTMAVGEIHANFPARKIDRDNAEDCVNKETDKDLEQEMKWCKKCRTFSPRRLFYWPPFFKKGIERTECQKCLMQPAVGHYPPVEQFHRDTAGMATLTIIEVCEDENHEQTENPDNVENDELRQNGNVSTDSPITQEVGDSGDIRGIMPSGSERIQNAENNQFVRTGDASTHAIEMSADVEEQGTGNTSTHEVLSRSAEEERHGKASTDTTREVTGVHDSESNQDNRNTADLEDGHGGNKGHIKDGQSKNLATQAEESGKRKASSQEISETQAKKSRRCESSYPKARSTRREVYRGSYKH